ncbi:hypothetical protein LDENG_00158560, partial [Lucifuga dentata]
RILHEKLRLEGDFQVYLRCIYTWKYHYHYHGNYFKSDLRMRYFLTKHLISTFSSSQ